MCSLKWYWPGLFSTILFSRMNACCVTFWVSLQREDFKGVVIWMIGFGEFLPGFVSVCCFYFPNFYYFVSPFRCAFLWLNFIAAFPLSVFPSGDGNFLVVRQLPVQRCELRLSCERVWWKQLRMGSSILSWDRHHTRRSKQRLCLKFIHYTWAMGKGKALALFVYELFLMILVFNL